MVIIRVRILKFYKITNKINHTYKAIKAFKITFKNAQVLIYFSINGENPVIGNTQLYYILFFTGTQICIFSNFLIKWL